MLEELEEGSRVELEKEVRMEDVAHGLADSGGMTEKRTYFELYPIGRAVRGGRRGIQMGDQAQGLAESCRRGQSPANI